MNKCIQSGNSADMLVESVKITPCTSPKSGGFLEASVESELSSSPMKKGRGVYLFVPTLNGGMYRALLQTVNSVFDADKMTVGDDFQSALNSGKYGLIIDASMLGKYPATDGTVERDMKNINAAEKPKVVYVKNVPTVLADIVTAVSKHIEEYDTKKQRTGLELLCQVVDRESYETICGALEKVQLTDLHDLGGTDEPSCNQTFTATHLETGDDLFIKIHRNKTKAMIEAAANYFMSQHVALGTIIAKGYFPKPIEHNGLYITVQKRICDGRQYSTHYYMAALAMLHSFGSGVIDDKITLPFFRARQFEQVLDDLESNGNPQRYRHLRSRYNEIAAQLEEFGRGNVIHSDAKHGNIKMGHILDLEGLKRGDPAVDISLYLVQTGIPKEEWGAYVATYFDVLQQMTGVSYTPEMLGRMTARVQNAAIVTGLKELGGLFSRQMDQAEHRQAGTIERFLSEAR